MKKIFLFITLLLTAMPSILKAENSDEMESRRIVGVVLDEQNNKPLPGASVSIVGTTISVGTNTMGEFSVNIKEGEYTLRATFMGYIPYEQPLGEGSQKLTIKLAPSNNGLEEVVITGTRTEKSLKDVPVLTRVISQEDIKRINPLNLKNILEFELPGIQFGRHHGSGLPTLSFQGSSDKYVLFLVDGERISGEGAADNIDFEQFNIDDIERIEVIKGAASTLYGSNALGGVVNIITKKADRPVVANLSGRYSSRHEQKFSASGGMKKNRFSFLNGISYRQKDAFTVHNKNGSGSVDINGNEIWQTTHKFNYVFSEKISADLKGSLYNNRQSTSEKIQNTYRDYALNGRLHYIVNSGHHLDFSYNIDDYIKYAEKSSTAGIRNKSKTFDNLKHTLRLDYNWSLSDASILSIGSEVNTEKLKHYMFADTTSHHVETYSLYVQEDWEIVENFNIVAGVRADYHSEYNLHVTPKLSLMYQAGDFIFRGGYASGFRSPSLKELYEEWNHANGPGFYVYGNPDLKPEKSNHFSISTEYTKGIFNGTVSGYYNRLSDKITQISIKDDQSGKANMHYANASKARTTGVDVTMQLRFGCGLTVKSAYTYVNDHSKIEGENKSTVRPHTATFSADYNHKFGDINAFINFNGRWMSSVKEWYKTEKVDPGTLNLIDVLVFTKHNSRTICSFNAGARFPRGIRLNMGLDNIFNFKDKSISSDTSISPEQGIGFVASLSINIADFFKL